jgi:hypothetical protein
MENSSFLQFVNRQKYLPIKVGFMVAAIHLLTVYCLILVDTSYGSFTFILTLILAAPSIFLHITGFDSELLQMIFSSLFYGVLAGLLVSRIFILQILILILVGLLILFFILALSWAGGMYA